MQRIVAYDLKPKQYETNCIVTYAVERFSSPQFQIQPKKGWKITAVLVNGEDVTDQLKDGMLTLPEVYEDQLLVVETEESTEDGKKDDKKDGSTGGGGREDTKPTDKKPTDTKNNGTCQVFYSQSSRFFCYDVYSFCTGLTSKSVCLPIDLSGSALSLKFSCWPYSVTPRSYRNSSTRAH